MTDYYFSADSYDAMAGFLTETTNGVFRLRYSVIVGPWKGHDAVPEMLAPDGTILPAIPAAGSPDAWYALIRTDENITEIPPNVSPCDEETGKAVLGIFL